ncbi:hypothetical protein ACTXGQ_03165 [Marinobacter sp. 1Y8]
MSEAKKEWCKFFNTLATLFKRGFRKPAPTLYFLSVICVAGGVGFWFPFLSTGKPDLNSAMTYVFALLAAVVADFFTSSRSEGFLDNWDHIEKDFTLLVVSLMILITSCAVIAMIIGYGMWAWIWMAISAFLVWFLWWILLEPQKFGLDRETVTQSTIGVAQPSSGKPGIGLEDLKKTRANKEGSHG